MVKELNRVAGRDRVLEIEDHDLGREGRDDGDELVRGAEDRADAEDMPLM